jgi:Uma2 family endonuclease
VATADLISDPAKLFAKLTPGERVHLSGLSWDEYRNISDALNGRHLRLTYDRGTLELMPISPKHGAFCGLLRRMVSVLTEELGWQCLEFSDMTCEREDLARGIEPDDSFYIHNAERVQGKTVLDLAVDPPPDLGLEIDISRSSRIRMKVYAALRVPEVWCFDGTSLTCFVLTAVGKYRKAKESRCFPHLRLADLVPFLQQWPGADHNTIIRSFREWVRQHLSDFTR